MESPWSGTPSRRDGRIGVVTLIDALTLGGAELLAVEIAKRLDPERFASTLCVSRANHPIHDAVGDLPERVRESLAEAGVGYIPLTRGAPWDTHAWGPLVSLLRSGAVEVMHGHMHGSNAWAVILGRMMRLPVVVAHEHTWSFTGEPLRRLVDRHLIAAHSDMLIACSEQDRLRMMEYVRIPSESVCYVPNGIAGRAPTPGRDVRAELGIAPDALVVGSVGMLREQKRYDVLLRAAVILKPRFPGLRVVIVGGGEGVNRPGLETLAEELELGDTLLLAGARGDIPDLLSAFDVAAVSSDYEGSPLSVMEYMEARLPVVSTDVGGVAQMVHDGVHGLLVPRRDPEALATAIGELLADPERRAQMGARGRERRRQEYDLAVMVSRIEKLYLDLLARRATNGRSTPSITTDTTPIDDSGH